MEEVGLRFEKKRSKGERSAFEDMWYCGCKRREEVLVSWLPSLFLWEFCMSNGCDYFNMKEQLLDSSVKSKGWLKKELSVMSSSIS